MFFKRSINHSFTPQDFIKVIQNLSAQQELLQRQLSEGSISQVAAQEEMRRLSSLKKAYADNLQTTFDEQQNSSASPQ